MNKYCNNDVYKSLFNLIYDNIGEKRKESNKLRQIEESLEKIIYDREKELPIVATSEQFNLSLLNIQNEIQRIIKENLKRDDEFGRNNSDVVLVERDEFVIASPRRKSKPIKTEEIIESINTFLRKLSDLTKPPDHSSKHIII
jgi:hypothetical protein